MAGRRQGDLPLITGEDLGQGFARAVRADLPETFDAFSICGPEFPTAREVIGFVAEEIRVPPPRFSVPYAAAHALALACEVTNPVMPGPAPFLTRSTVHLARDWFCPDDRARYILGYAPTGDWRAGVRAALFPPAPVVGRPSFRTDSGNSTARRETHLCCVSRLSSALDRRETRQRLDGGMTATARGFHPGELLVQKQAGLTEDAAQLEGMLFNNSLDGRPAKFLADRTFGGAHRTRRSRSPLDRPARRPARIPARRGDDARRAPRPHRSARAGRRAAPPG